VQPSRELGRVLGCQQVTELKCNHLCRSDLAVAPCDSLNPLLLVCLSPRSWFTEPERNESQVGQFALPYLMTRSAAAPARMQVLLNTTALSLLALLPQFSTELRGVVAPFCPSLLEVVMKGLECAATPTRRSFQEVISDQEATNGLSGETKPPGNLTFREAIFECGLHCLVSGLSGLAPLDTYLLLAVQL
jgi:hypothetical protein